MYATSHGAVDPPPSPRTLRRRIEDAVVPAGCLREAEGDSIVAALRRYEAIRKPRASKVQRLSRTRGEPWPRGDGWHLPDGEQQRQRGKEGREVDRAFYLEAWNGTNSYSVDRIGRGAPRVCFPKKRARPR